MQGTHFGLAGHPPPRNAYQCLVILGGKAVTGCVPCCGKGNSNRRYLQSNALAALAAAIRPMTTSPLSWAFLSRFGSYGSGLRVRGSVVILKTRKGDVGLRSAWQVATKSICSLASPEPYKETVEMPGGYKEMMMRMVMTTTTTTTMMMMMMFGKP